jgi:hypothetical protein
MRVWLWLSCCLCLACSDSSKDPEPADAEADAGAAPAEAGQPVEDGICTSCDSCEEYLAVGSFNHLEGSIDYPSLPPAGGDHNACWTTFGVHARELEDDYWVHNLEHGAVVFLHNCPDGCDDEREQLEALVDTRPFALVMPYAKLPTRFGVVAWEYRLLSDCFDETAFTEFYTDHVNRARESTTSPPPSGCPVGSP